MNKGALIGIGLLVVILIMGVSSYNGLVGMNEAVTAKWSQVENQLQRRADLIPNLVNTVKGYAAQEKDVMQSVADARAKLAGAQGPAAKAQADSELSGALSRLLVVVENYPDLKSNQNFRALQDELAGTENRLSVARMDYNNVVQSYNAKIKTFPTSLFANMLGFSAREYFKAQEGAQQVPNVQF